MSIATVVVTVLTALLFLGAAAMKLTGQAHSLQERDHFGIAAAQWRLIGVLELAGAVGALVGLAWRPIGIAATAGLTLTSIGALLSHARAGDPPAKASAALLALVLSAGALVLQIITA